MTMQPDHSTPPAADPAPGHNPGYAENQPRDQQDAREPGARNRVPKPDDGGLDRKPEAEADASADHSGAA